MRDTSKFGISFDSSRHSSPSTVQICSNSDVDHDLAVQFVALQNGGSKTSELPCGKSYSNPSEARLIANLLLDFLSGYLSSMCGSTTTVPSVGILTPYHA